MDLLLALVFVLVAYLLGSVVDPVLFVIVTAPALWLVGSHDRRVRA